MRVEIRSWVQWQQAVVETANDAVGDAADKLAPAGDGMTTINVLTLVFAGLAVLVSIVSVVLTNRRSRANEKTARDALEDARLARQEGNQRGLASEKLAGEALNDARLARKEAVELALWTSTIEAVNRLAGFDPAVESIGTRLQDLRVRIMLLGDHFDQWDGFDKWLAEEHALGTNMGQEAMETFNPGAPITEQLDRVGRYAGWAMAFSSNLRLLRRVGYKPKRVAHLRAHARSVRESMYVKYGWGQVLDSVPGIELLDDDLFPDEPLHGNH